MAGVLLDTGRPGGGESDHLCDPGISVAHMRAQQKAKTADLCAGPVWRGIPLRLYIPFFLYQRGNRYRHQGICTLSLCVLRSGNLCVGLPDPLGEAVFGGCPEADPPNFGLQLRHLSDPSGGDECGASVSAVGRIRLPLADPLHFDDVPGFSDPGGDYQKNPDSKIHGGIKFAPLICERRSFLVRSKCEKHNVNTYWRGKKANLEATLLEKTRTWQGYQTIQLVQVCALMCLNGSAWNDTHDSKGSRI